MIKKIWSICFTVAKKVLLFVIAGLMCLSSFAPPALETPEVMNKDTGEYFLPDYGSTLISSHRSGKGAAPENTLMAVKSNLIYSQDDSAIIEMDVQLTKDGVVVLYHSLFLDELSDSEEHFGKKNIPVFMKTYEELRGLNMGEHFEVKVETETETGKETVKEYPYRGLRGDAIPDDIRMTALKDVFECVETEAPGKYRYIIEVKYPHPWAPKIVDGIYALMEEYDLGDRLILASFWPDVSYYIDEHYEGKINRSANPFEIVDFYGKYTRNEDLSGEKIKFSCLQMPYYWDDGILLVANLGKTGFIDYAHKYGISMQYWTVNSPEDAKHLAAAGADLLMTDYPDRIRKALYGE